MPKEETFQLPFDGTRSPKTTSAQRLFYVALCAVSTIFFGLCAQAVVRPDTILTEGDPLSAPALDRLVQIEAATEPVIAFVGSSHFLRGIDTAALDRDLAAAGCPAEPIVIAFAGISADEERLTLHQIAGLERAPTLIVLPTFLRSVNGRSNPLTVDWQHLPGDLRYDAAHNVADGDTAVRVLTDRSRTVALSLLGYRTFADIWPTAPLDRPPTDRGYVPYTGNERRADEAVIDAISIRMNAAHDVPWNGIEPYTLARNERRIDGLGPNTPVLFMELPQLERLPAESLSAPGLTVGENGYPYLNLNNERYAPSLLRPELWQNPGHLSNEGAEWVSAILAPYICQQLGRGP